MSHRRLAMLQPAPPGGIVEITVIVPEKNDDAVDAARHPARKRAGVNSSGACTPCRKGKRRCDGGKPICGACLKRDIERGSCVYDQMEGLSRAGTLKYNAQLLEAERNSLRTFVKDLLTVAPGTTVEEGMRLTEKHGSLLPPELRVEIKDMVRQKHPCTIENGVCTNDSILTPITSARDSYTGQSSPDFDAFYPRSADICSSSPTTTTNSTEIEQSHTSEGSLSNKDHPDQGSNDHHNYFLPRRGSRGSYEANSFSQQALSALCDRMAQENTQNLFSHKGQTGKQWTGPRLTTHLQVYAHLPLANLAGRVGWPPEIDILNPQVLDFQIPIYMVQPLLLKDESPLSRTVVGFLELARARVKQGWPLLDILGPIDFDVSRLTSIDIGYNPHYDVFSVPGWATSVVMTFPNASTIVKLSLVLQLARLMRWLIAPTPDNYALIPESQRPTPLQRMVPHKAEFDFIMLPTIRDALIMRPREYIQVYLDSAKCDWSSACPSVEIDAITNCLRITPAFEKHISNDDNWYFDTSILQVFPELLGKCNHHGAG